MDAPSVVTPEERRAIAKEIALKYVAFAATIHVAFSKRGILIEVLPDKELNTPPGVHKVIVHREDF